VSKDAGIDLLVMFMHKTIGLKIFGKRLALDEPNSKSKPFILLSCAVWDDEKSAKFAAVQCKSSKQLSYFRARLVEIRVWLV
jgi:hypothetical protein